MGHTLSRARRERRRSHELVVVALTVQQIETAVLSAAEQRDVLHRRVAVGNGEPNPALSYRTDPQTRGAGAAS